MELKKQQKLVKKKEKQENPVIKKNFREFMQVSDFGLNSKLSDKKD
jgi:hypothetical protein